MKIAALSIGSALVVGGLVACSHGSKSTSGPAKVSTFAAVDAKPSRQLPSKSSATNSESSYTLPPYQEKLLDNGLRILFVPDQSLPYVSYALLVRVGAIQDPEGLPGLTSLVTELLDKGTKKRSAPQIAADLGQLGAELEASTTTEFSVVNASGLSTQADALLSNLLEIVTEPTFSDTEIERARKQTLSVIQRQEDNPEAFSEQAFDRLLFGQHPYSRPVIGTIKSVTAIRKKHIIQQYLHYFRPNNSFLAVVGKYTPELAAKIEKEFSKWQPREVSPAKLPAEEVLAGLKVELVDKPGLVQAQIHIGNLGIARKDPDFLALRVANTILGGAFSSRLVDRIRKDLGLTYSISSSFEARLEPGAFQISTFTKNNSVAQTVGETLKVLANFKENGVTQAEVEQAQGYLKGIFPTAIETPEKLAFNMLMLRFYGVEDTYLTGYLADMSHLTAADVNRAIQKHINDKDIRVLVYSNGKDVLPQLQDLTQKLGAELLVKKSTDL